MAEPPAGDGLGVVLGSGDFVGEGISVSRFLFLL
jgi:hypothetical protein